MGSAVALVGAQWGSEGKGVIAHGLSKVHRFSAAVRVGGPNAGHSFFEGGKVYKMRSVPCSWVDPATVLVIGAGAVINPHTLLAELAAIPSATVFVDRRAVLIDEEMEHAEAGIKESIGSTGEGVGQARIARIRRDGSAQLAEDYAWPTDRVQIVPDASILLDGALSSGDVMVEGTQGSGLSLFHGEYPYCTSTDTNVGGMLAEAGIAPARLGHTFLVARSFPIRVGGNSGPMGTEMSWDWFVERGIVDAPERTTVTNKQRRIAVWSDDVFDTAVRLNAPCGIWLTFADYLDVSIRGETDGQKVFASPAIGPFVAGIEQDWGVPVLGFGTGGDGWRVAMRGKAICSHGESWDFSSLYTGQAVTA